MEMAMPAKRPKQLVTIQLGEYGATFLATRTQVIPVLKSASLSVDEGYFEFEGTERQLNEAGVGNGDMFVGIMRGTQRTRTDEYGDLYMLVHHRDYWTLGLSTTNS